MSSMMRALVYEGPRQMNIRNIPVPSPGEKQVLIRVERVGICGSELGGFLGHNSLRVPPLVMGHEFSGVVAEAGSGATKFRPGDRVTVNPLGTCGECEDCLGSSEQLCPSRRLLGAHAPGAFAEYVAVPERDIHLIPDSVSFDQAAFAEPFACAVHLCRLIALRPEDRLLVLGAGPIGLFALAAARTLGLENIVVADLNADRLRIAAELGSTPAQGDAEIASLKPAEGFHAAVDAVGAASTRLRCVQSVRRGGRIGLTGLHEADTTLPINSMIREELKLFGAFAYSRNDFETALRWIAEGSIDLLPWTEHRSLDEGQSSFEKLVSGPGAIAKIMLCPST
ncbi:galactitol-1-phosphate 5-dehydrogenase [Paenibacillus sp. J5C_2022]|uniref:zinc-dependent alcohol dehydrogenase n=1 Tax=Paenibacillus sp. J5C2022 TaxID=2977129 RepID=UPI0021CE6960|nr:galactitol-1-phosphate 5-dehydrogenase [Paenibacillus sp. J5C2022]MCU6711201.1 galactitol-1-phosphate 5-dehydrogenase [Paenibacillus sp. J5C2022]